MSNYYVKTIERAAAPRSRRLREAGGYHSGGASSPGGGYLPLTGGTIVGDLRVRGNFIVGDVVIAMDADGRLHISKGVVSDGDLAAFGAEEGEEGGSGGLDIARLWEELAAADASKIIDVSHLPSDVVLQDELTDALSPYAKKTDLNSALADYAKSDWVTEQLSKYLLLTGGKISGDLEVGGSLTIGDAVISYSNGQLRISKTIVSEGDLAAFGAEEGEEGGSGGLDIARLWEELAAADASKIIDVSHIPGSVVLQDELIGVLDDYPLTTEMNEALGDKADKDWVEDELAKYLLLTGGKISGDLEVTGSLTIGDAVISYSNGQLHISKAVVSEGDLAAFGASSGSTSGGGLDVNRLWDELRADDSSKVIDVSHIPDSVVLQDELTDTLSPYAKKTDLNSALADYAKSDWVTEQLSKYLLLTGGTMSGTLRINSTSEAFTQYLINGTKKAAHGYLPGKGSYIYNYSADKYLNITDSSLLQFGNSTVWHSGNDGSGSGLDADMLDGTHKSELLTSVTSTSTTNLSVVVGGTTKSAADLYATYLGGKTLAETRRGMSFLSSQFSAAGWYRVFTSINANTIYFNEVILHIGRTYASPQNEHYSFSICVGYNGDISITQLSGVMGGHLITKIRVVWDNSQIFHIDIYSAASSYNNTYGVTGQGYGTFYAFTPNATIPGGYTAYEFTTVDGCKSDRGFTGTLSGNAASATKLATARTLWGQSFNGTANVSGSISSSYFYLSDSSSNPYLKLMVGDAKAYLQMTSAGISMDYGRSSGKIVYLSSAGNVGIGTTAPAHKLHVAGTGYFKDDLEVGGSLTIGDAVISYSNGQLRISKTVVSEGDLAAFGASSGSTSGGGLDVDRLWEELRADDSSKVIDESHLPLSVVLQDELTTTLSSYVKKTEFNSAIAGFLPLSGGTVTGDITMSGSSIRIPQSPSASSYAGILNADGSKMILAYYGNNTYAGMNTGTFYLRSGAANLVHRRNGVDYAVLDAYNYSSTLDGVYLKKGQSISNSVYRRYISLNGAAKYWLSDVNPATDGNMSFYAPTTAGTSGYVLKATGGTPAWAAQNSLVVKGIYERSLGVAAGDTMADLKSALLTQMGSGLNKPGSMGFVTTTSVANIMSNWANDDYKLVAGSRTNFLRLDGYESSTYGVFLVSGYQGSFYRLLKNSSTAWGGPYLILDTGNYASTLDSRYVNVSGDTMTGDLTLNSDLNLSANSHIIFNRESFNYLSVPLNGTYAFVVGTTLNGANTVLGIDAGKVFPGYHNGTISLGSSSYRWSSVYSVAGNFSGDVSVSGDITGFTSLLSKAGSGNRRTYISSSDFNLVAATSAWAFGLCVLTNDRSALLGTIAGAYGSGDNLSRYYYYGGSYTSPLMVIKPSGDVGIGTTSPAYKFHVAGTGYFSSILTLGDSSRLDFVIGGTTRRAIYDDGTFAFYGDPSYATGIRGSKIILQNAVGNTAVMIEDNDISFYGRLYVPSVDGNRKYYLRIA